MPTLEAIVNSTAYALSDGAPFSIVNTEDGMAPIRRITDRGPLQHGDSDLDFRLEPLSWPLGLRIAAGSISEHYTNRATALRIFRPSLVVIKMRWTLDNGDVRQLDCHVAGRMAFSSANQDGFHQRCVVPLRAADPTYYDPTLQSTPFGVGGGSGAFTVPVAVPTGVGAATVDQTTAIVYPGTWRTYPVVVITGPINSPIITNQTTGDKLDFTGTNLGGSDIYTIDCAPGVKTVKDQTDTNKIAALTDDSDLATFSLETDPEAPGGVNSIRVQGSSATSATQVTVRYYVRYIGI